MRVADLDRQIDALYQRPASEFTAARNALARTLTGEAARGVRALKKPSAVAWTVNQVYWKARPAYDALMKKGHTLRAAQIAALEGKKSDVRGAADAHRRALADAVARAETLARDAGVNPGVDHLARMLETLSLAGEPAADAGRFVDVIGPSGFDVLTGVKAKAAPQAAARAKQRKAEEKAREDEKRKRAAEARLRAAEHAASRARAKADDARRALNRAEAELAEAERALSDAQAAAEMLHS